MTKCPECGEEIVKAQAKKHAIYHWGDLAKIPTQDKEAIKRYKEVLAIGGEK